MFAFTLMIETTEPVPPVAPGNTKRNDLEIKDAQLIFGSVWRELEAEFGHEHMRFPKEIILLGGAPGAGKGTNTAFIARSAGLTCQPIVISSLLKIARGPGVEGRRRHGRRPGCHRLGVARIARARNTATASSWTGSRAPRCRSNA